FVGDVRDEELAAQDDERKDAVDRFEDDVAELDLGSSDLDLAALDETSERYCHPHFVTQCTRARAWHLATVSSAVSGSWGLPERVQTCHTCLRPRAVTNVHVAIAILFGVHQDVGEKERQDARFERRVDDVDGAEAAH